MPKLFKIIKYFPWDEKCKIYLNTVPETAQFDGYVSDIPYWLLELKVWNEGAISVEDGILCLVVKE